MTANVRHHGAGARVILIRHGQASLGSTDYDRLSPVGQMQAVRLRRRLAAVFAGEHSLWSGTHHRHRQTSEALCPEAAVGRSDALDEFPTFALIRAALDQAGRLGIERPREQELAEPARYLESLLQWFPAVLEAWQADRLSTPETGSWPSFRDRVLAPVDRWRAQAEAGRNVVVISSAGVISTLVAELTGSGLGRQRRLAVTMYNASVTELWPVATGWETGPVNCIEHLDEAGLRTLA
ncbi:MAG: histidine phosphatase family protein [Wenzhouxiangella sp.]